MLLPYSKIQYFASFRAKQNAHILTTEKIKLSLFLNNTSVAIYMLNTNLIIFSGSVLLTTISTIPSILF